MSKPLRQFIAATISASLLLTPFYSLSVSAKQNEANWFEQSDISLPKGTKVAQLGNEMHYILLPTSRNSKTLSIRLRLAAPSSQSHTVAEKLFKGSEWTLEEFKGQSVIKRDFDKNDTDTLSRAIEELASLVKSDSATGTFTPGLSSVIVAGNFRLRTTQELIEKNFSDWKPNLAFNLVANDGLTPNTDVAQSTEKPTVAYTAHTKINDDPNSKLQRKKLLVVTIANKILEKRLKEALAEQKVTVEVSNQVLAQSNLVSQVSVTSDDSEQAKAAQKIIQQEINRARTSGFKQAEYEMVVSQLREHLEKQTRRYDDAYTAHQADQLVKAIDEGRVYTSPSYDLDLMNFHVAHLNEFDISNEFERVWQNPMELVIIPNS